MDVRSIATAIPITPSAAERTPATKPAGPGFADALEGAIDRTEGLHTDAEKQISELLQGNQSNLHSVMISVEKADIAFQLMMQVRNKVVSAYQEIEHLQF